jgi:pyruvate dehydrogenase (quinone)
MAELVADYVLRRLTEWGVHRIYGYPGDGINAFLGALDRADGEPAFVQVRHEEMAALMACGHAKFTGEVGVCLATSGPGAIHLLNGLYDAKLDHQPVVARWRASRPSPSSAGARATCSNRSPRTPARTAATTARRTGAATS